MAFTRSLLLAIVLAIGAAPAVAQQAPGRGGRDGAGPGRGVSAEALRRDLFILAADSMGGRDTGSRGDFLAAEYVAARFRRVGLRPAGENGTFFQTLPFARVHPDTAAALVVAGARLRAGDDFASYGDWKADGAQAIYGGLLGDSATYPGPAALRGRLVVLTVPADLTLRQVIGRAVPTARALTSAGAGAVALVALDRVPADLRDQFMQGRYTTDTSAVRSLLLLLVTDRAGAALLGAPLAGLQAGAVGPALSGGAAYRRDPLPYAARNVIAVLPGSDPALAMTYVSVSAHNDHIGSTSHPVDHDSVYAHNRVLRPLGADSPDREATAPEAAHIAALGDSLRRLRPDRPDSVFNGADDDGSGTVALLEVARVLAAAPHPRRSVLFVSHVAEERGLVGSAWFTDHPTVPRDSIVGEIDMDMIGRGDATDLAEGGPGYLESIGSRRLSREFGDVLEQVNARQPRPFTINYAYDAPGHPLQYYCRADHYSYARYGIPSVALSRGEHADYHQVTDEAEYIDYAAAARVAAFVADFAWTLASLDHRPLVDGPRPDPRAPCRQ